MDINNLVCEALSNNQHQYRDQIKLNSNVAVVKKEHQRTGEITKGKVKRILTKSKYHPRGIKVQLHTGEVGRVLKLL